MPAFRVATARSQHSRKAFPPATLVCGYPQGASGLIGHSPGSEEVSCADSRKCIDNSIP